MEIDTYLIILNLVLTFLTTILTSTRIRSKCCGGEVNWRPSGLPPSPETPVDQIVVRGENSENSEVVNV